LLDQKNRRSLLGQRLRQLQDAIHHKRRQTRRRLIQDQQARLGYQALYDRQNLLLPATQARGGLPPPFGQFGERFVN
jgi:hypothetical protein